MDENSMLTGERLGEVLDYDKDTGLFIWLRQTGRRVRVGDVAGHVRNNQPRMVEIRIDKKAYLAHRLAYLWMTGEWPANEIDHVNGNMLDNRWCNLRAATSAQNSWNSRKHFDNITGLKGVTWRKDTQKWTARLMKDGKVKQLGCFDSSAAAHAAYVAAAEKAFGDFARF